MIEKVLREFLFIILLSAAVGVARAVGADSYVCPERSGDSAVQDTITVESDSVVAPEQKSPNLIKRLSNELTTRYFSSKYDSNYVVRPEGKLTLKIRLNQTGNTFHAKGTLKEVYSKTDLSTSHKTTVSIGASYRGLSAALSLNPAKMSGAYKDYELNLNYYSSRISIDFSYLRSETLSGDIIRDRSNWTDYDERTNLQRLEHGDATLKVVNMAIYYTFNHRRFSYSAAFTQSYIQRRSAGSWLAGISYQGGSIKTNEELKARSPNAAEVSMKVGHIGIGGGYGFNWVPGKKWLLHLSLLPTVVVYNNNNLSVNGESIDAQRIRLNMIFNERAAIVYNFSLKKHSKASRYFAGATLVMNNSIFDDKAVTINQNKWRARAFIGVRLY